MLLTGTFPRAIDEKQRLAIPKRLRDALLPVVGGRPQTNRVAERPAQPAADAAEVAGEADDESLGAGALYVAPGTDGSLAIYTEESFANLAQQLSASPPTGQDVRAFSRLFYSQAERVELDRQGRIRIPPELARLAGLKKEVVLVGVRDHLELWDKERWDTYIAQQSVHYDQLAEKAFRPT